MKKELQLRLIAPNLLLPISKGAGKGVKISILTGGSMYLPDGVDEMLLYRPPKRIHIFLTRVARVVRDHIKKEYPIEYKKGDAICITSIDFFNLRKHFWEKNRWRGEVWFDILKFGR